MLAFYFYNMYAAFHLRQYFILIFFVFANATSLIYFGRSCIDAFHRFHFLLLSSLQLLFIYRFHISVTSKQLATATLRSFQASLAIDIYAALALRRCNCFKIAYAFIKISAFAVSQKPLVPLFTKIDSHISGVKSDEEQEKVTYFALRRAACSSFSGVPAAFCRRSGEERRLLLCICCVRMGFAFAQVFSVTLRLPLYGSSKSVS